MMQLVTYLILTCSYDLSRRIAVVVQKQRQDEGTECLHKNFQILYEVNLSLKTAKILKLCER